MQLPPWTVELIARGAEAFGKISWKKLIEVAVWLYGLGAGRAEKTLMKAERRELGELLARSNGRKKNLSQKERQRFVSLVYKGVTGKKKQFPRS